MQDLISNVPGVVWEAYGKPDSKKQRINFVSDHVTEMLGYSVEEWTTTPNFWLKIVHPADKERAAATAALHFEQGGEGINQFRWVAKDGRLLWVESHSTCVKDEKGKVIGMRGVVLDITERKKVEERIEQILQGMTDSFISFDSQWRFTYLNVGSEKLLGKTMEELVGKSLTETFPEALSSPFFRRLEKAMKHREPLRFEEYSPELNGWFRGSAYPVFDGGLALYIEDITEVRQATDELARSNERFRLAQKVGKIGTFEYEFRTENLIWTTESERMFGMAPGSFSGTIEAWLRYVHPEDLARVEDEMEQAIQKHTELDTQYRIVLPTGETCWIISKASTYYDHLGKPLRMIGIHMDASEQIQAQETIRHQAFHDPLTGLPNRLLMEDRLEVAIKHARRHGTKVAVLFLDLDRFKNVNDTLGHHVGDLLLREVAKVLVRSVREENTVVRFGGDEFLIMAPDISDLPGLEQMVQRVITAFEEPIVVEGHTVHVGVSIGVAMYPMHGKEPVTLLKHADAALYVAKGDGRNTYQLFDDRLGVQASKRLNLENDLRMALKQGDLQVFYQPIVSVKEHTVLGAEALLRWDHPQFGLLFPEEFIYLAEENGQITEIGDWLLASICQEVREWDTFTPKPLEVFMNVSMRQFELPNFHERIANTLHKYAIDPGRVTCEITESLAMKNASMSLPKVQQLKELGLRIAIDDFGVGHSSLSYLKQFPIDEIKIDKTFVDHCLRDHRDAAIIQAVVTLAQSLQVTTVAEGVEQAKQRAFLEKVGCDAMQGFLISHAVSGKEFRSWLKQWLDRTK